MIDVTELKNPKRQAGADLYNSLGSFWSTMYDDADYVYRLMQGFGMTYEQLKIKFAETQDCLGLATVPPYSRVKYQFFTILKSGRNTGKTSELTFGMQYAGNIGPQAESSPYETGTELEIGGNATRVGYVSYPLLGVEPDEGMLMISDSLSQPRVVLTRGIDYYVDAGSLVFREDRDPFGANLSKFFLTGAVDSGRDKPDEVLLLWGMEALYDENYVEDHFGHLYVGGPRDPQYYKELVNAAGSLYSGGTAELNVRQSLGRMFRTAVAEERELVIDVYERPDGSQIVATRRNVYEIRPEETLKDAVTVEYELSPGEFLTNTVRLYQTLNPNVFEQRNKLTLQDFREDFAELRLKDGVSAVGGLVLGWENVPILYRGLDDNGNPRYSFDVGDTEVNDEFWQYVFDKSERDGVNMLDLFEGYVTEGHSEVDGEAVGMISPIRYFLRNFFCANASALAVDFDALPQYIRELDVTRILSEVSAVYTKTFVLAKVRAEQEIYDLETMSSEKLSDMPAAPVSDAAGVDGSLTYYDTTVRTRRVRV